MSQNVDDALSIGSLPFSLVDFVGRTSLEDHVTHNGEDEEFVDSFLSKQTLKTMPSYLGDYKPKFVIINHPFGNQLSIARHCKFAYSNVHSSDLHALFDRFVEDYIRYLGECSKMLD